MVLLDRLYYPLDKAAEKLTNDGLPCDVDDLIHFAAIGKLEICVRVNSQILLPSFQVHEFRRANLKKGTYINIFYPFRTDFGYLRISSYDSTENRNWLKVDSNTLLAISQYVFQGIEHLKSHENMPLNLYHFTFPRDYELYEVDDFDGGRDPHKLFFNSPGIKTSASNLVITAKELELFKGGGKPIDAPKQRMVLQEDRILALLKQKGYDPEKLPEHQKGKSGVKAKIWKLAENETSIFISKVVFDKAWGRLRTHNRIQEMQKT